ncbi:TPA: hypothetical protein DEP96_03640 [Candidatus Uhrbacteria bacterium]|nr:hypothetical protein [Candidatus Uhrbacteria bacterium]
MFWFFLCVLVFVTLMAVGLACAGLASLYRNHFAPRLKSMPVALALQIASGQLTKQSLDDLAEAERLVRMRFDELLDELGNMYWDPDTDWPTDSAFHGTKELRQLLNLPLLQGDGVRYNKGYLLLIKLCAKHVEYELVHKQFQLGRQYLDQGVHLVPQLSSEDMRRQAQHELALVFHPLAWAMRDEPFHAWRKTMPFSLVQNQKDELYMLGIIRRMQGEEGMEGWLVKQHAHAHHLLPAWLETSLGDPTNCPDWH